MCRTNNTKISEMRGECTIVKVGCIIQARMGSTRMPGKVMEKIEGKTVLSHVINRVKKVELIDEIIIATTTKKNDDLIVNESEKNNVRSFRGSENDVLSRYYNAAKKFHIDVVVRITSDCPLIDPTITNKIINFYMKNTKYDLVTNAGIKVDKRTYPRGLDVEVFSFKVLENSFLNAKENYQREHVTPYIYEKSKNIYFYQNDINLSKYRLTLDTPEDFKLISKIYGYLYKGKHDFFLEGIIDLLEKRPDLIKINSEVIQKKVKGE